ncbi:MAG: SemiSWEET transporter [Nevskia sp.]|nr:SemiSWEET transporter [Nevskia sp.]
MSFSLIDVFGFAGAACTTLAFVPQVIRVWRTRSAADISAGMYVVFIAGLVLWLVYGVLMVSWPIIAANCLTLVLAGAVLWMKWRFHRPSFAWLRPAGGSSVGTER